MSNFAGAGSIGKKIFTKFFYCEFLIFFIFYPVGIGECHGSACGGGMEKLALWRMVEVNSKVT